MWRRRTRRGPRPSFTWTSAAARSQELPPPEPARRARDHADGRQRLGRQARLRADTRSHQSRTMRGGARQPQSPAAHESRGVQRWRRTRSTRPCRAAHAHIDCGDGPATIACSTTAARTARRSCATARRSASPPAREACVCSQATRSSSARRDSAFVDPRDHEHTTSVSCLARRHWRSRGLSPSSHNPTTSNRATRHSVLATLERSSWRPAASS